MAFESGALEAALAAAVGDDPALVAELRGVFRASVTQHADALARSRCDANWRTAALRLQGVAASFGAMALMAAAREAAEGAPGDPVALRKIGRTIDLLDL